jgi:CRISPR-associated protein Cmr4
MKTFVFKITCLTNLHAGSGDAAGYGVVDKQVQRDPANSLPTIHASSLKGALREHFDGQAWVTKIFGSSNKEKDRAEDKIQRGSHAFFAADLLGIPVPKDDAPYFEVVKSKAIEDELRTKFTALGAQNLPAVLISAKDNATAFKDACDNLPVIARNALDNGISQNLWYEEVVPRQSVFVACIQGVENSELANALDNKVVQVGGNATVGYGYCQFTLLNPTKA